MKQYWRVNSTGFVFGFLSSCAFAQGFGGSVSVSSGESDNAFKTEDNLLSERQDTYKLGVKGEYSNQFLSATAEYTGQDQRYAKGSQEDKAFVEGSSALLLGAASSPVDLELKHSRRTLLGAPDDINISTNQDDREILSVIPRFKKKLSNADLFIASAEFTHIEFTKNELNNSERVTAALSWLRDISRISSLSLEVEQTDISFENFNVADYRYTNSMLVYSRQLRRLAYSLAAGYNQSERELGGTYDSPTYTASVNYKTAYHNFQLTSNRAITDSSLGGGNVPSVNLNPTNDGAFNVDQIERTNTELSWTTQILCIRCTAGFSWYSNKDNYLVLSDEGRQKGGAVNFSYAFSDNARLSYRFSDMKQTFAGTLLGKDYNYRTQLLEVSFDLSRDIGTRVFYEKEARDSDTNSRTYEENFFGAAISYAF
jgi:hypothetical protein